MNPNNASTLRLMSCVGFSSSSAHLQSVSVCCAFHGLKSNSYSVCNARTPLWLPPMVEERQEDQRCCAISPCTGIIRRRIWFISLWKEGYLPPRAEGPSTSNRAQVLWSPTRSRRWVEQCRAPLWLPRTSWLCLRLWTPALGRWMAIFSHVRDLMWSDSWEDFGP